MLVEKKLIVLVGCNVSGSNERYEPGDIIVDESQIVDVDHLLKCGTLAQIDVEVANKDEENGSIRN